MPTGLERLRRLALATAGAAATGSVAWLLAGSPEVRELVFGLLPLVLVMTLLLEWVTGLPDDDRWANFLLERVEGLWDGAGSGFYGIMAVCWFVRAEVLALQESFLEAGSWGDFLGAEIGGLVVGFSVQSLLNFIWAVVWWMPLFSVDGLRSFLVVVLSAFAVFTLARWAWIDRDDPLHLSGHRPPSPTDLS